VFVLSFKAFGRAFLTEAVGALTTDGVGVKVDGVTMVASGIALFFSIKSFFSMLSTTSWRCSASLKSLF